MLKAKNLETHDLGMNIWYLPFKKSSTVIVVASTNLVECSISGYNNTICLFK